MIIHMYKIIYNDNIDNGYHLTLSSLYQFRIQFFFY